MQWHLRAQALLEDTEDTGRLEQRMEELEISMAELMSSLEKQELELR